MWSIPYNLNIFNSYFGVGMAKLNSRFSSDLLPYWYKQMITFREGKHFHRSEAGQDLVFKHKDLFVIGMFQSGYHPILNIRSKYYLIGLLSFSPNPHCAA